MKSTAAVLALCFSPAHAQDVPCAPREDVVALLAERFGEAPQGMGIAKEGVLMEVWASPDTGTWSITGTTADGTACLVATGKMWEGARAAPLPQGDPT